MASVALAVDLGGTNVRCSVVDSEGHLLFESRESSGADEGPDAVIRRIVRLVHAAADDQRLPDDVAIGVVAPGPLDPRAGVVLFSPNLAGWNDVPLRDRVEQATGRRAILANDANAAALGEYYFGAAKDVENMIYIGLGTGLGGGVIAEGKLIDGKRGMGGELGHTVISIHGPRCTCGSQGCLEAYCSGWAIARDGAALVRSDRAPLIKRFAGAGEIDARAVARAAEAGDADAAAVIENAGYALGVGFGSFINIFNPEMIVIGGGLARIGRRLLDPAKRAMRNYALPDLLTDVTLTGSALGTRTGIYGAAALVFHDEGP
jgi:glucokinase